MGGRGERVCVGVDVGVGVGVGAGAGDGVKASPLLLNRN